MIWQQISLSIPLAHAQLGNRNIKLSEISNVHKEEEAVAVEMKWASFQLTCCTKVSGLLYKSHSSSLLEPTVSLQMDPLL